MTPGDNGASKPEDDDPFGYLYADGQAAGATPPSGGGGYGYPGGGRSYNQVRTVGERQYGQPPQAPAHAPQIPGQQQAPSYNQAHYAAPETFPGGPPATPPQQPAQGGGGRGRGPNTKMLLIGALAVVAAVVIGIGVAVINGDSGEKDDQAGKDEQKQTQGPADTAKPSDEPSKDAKDPEDEVELPQSDANSLTLAGGAVTASDVDGAKATGGTYVAGLNTPGASATWTVNDIPKNGKYTLNVTYGVPGKDANTTLTVNGKAHDRPLNMENFAKAKEGEWERGWTNTWSNVLLTKGTNIIKISCETGNACEVNLDQLSLEKGWR
ncbi:carbohydrate-binding protein [Streptomyces sp. E11-3]|uniref:carbohydrate-binding protein n=1 Tax=Streptomyces sp. E11-3 TaxID=3110112 RepID=UPI00397F31ED